MKKLIILLFATTALSYSCDDAVDLDPEYSQDSENFFKTATDYERALIGAYDLLQTSYLDVWIGEIASDNSIAGGESVNDSQGLHEIDEMNHGALNGELRDVLRFNYAGIARTNYLFEFRDNIEFDGKDALFAEAHFLRAYYYFQLVKFFGDVPLIVDRRLPNEEVASSVRTPASEVYAQIESDLIAAEANLPWTQAVKGKATKGAALALLGRVYLYQDKFTESAEALDRVILEGSYSLDVDYSSLFLVSNEDSPEVVFDIQYTGEEGGSYDCFVCLEGNVAVGFHGIRGYDGPVYGDGNSYSLPTQDLYDAFDAADPRRDATILDIDAFIADQGSDITYAVGGGGHTGYYNNKYIKRLDERGLPDDDLTSPVNHKVIRYADVLLMAAEAHNRKTSPNDALAQTYLNQVRSRVGMSAFNTSGQALTDAIWAERRLELSGEGFRFFDLVRTGRAATEIANFTTGKNELFPIPQVEIDLAGGNWSQNPNY